MDRLDVDAPPDRGVRRVDVHVIGDEVGDLVVGHRVKVDIETELDPRHTLRHALNRSVTHAQERGALTLLGQGFVLRRRTHVDSRRVTRRRRTDRRKQRLELIILEILRLIEDKDVYGEATARALGASDELDRPAVGQQNRLLPVRLADLAHHRGEVGKVTLVLEEAEQTHERLARRLHLVRGVQELQAEHDHAVKLDRLERAILAVLARHADAPRISTPSARLRAPHPCAARQRLIRVEV